MKILRNSLATWFILSSQVSAEVCDKVVRGWTPEDGAANALAPLSNFFVSPAGLVFAASVTIALIIKRRWIYITNALFVFVVALLTILTWADLAGLGGIRQAAMREGCLAAPWALLAFLFFAFAVFAFLAKRAPAKV